MSGSFLRPRAPPGTANSPTPSKSPPARGRAVRKAASTRSASCPYSTNSFAPSSRKPPARRAARSRSAAPSRRGSAPSKSARVAIASPAARRGSHSSCCARLPPSRSATTPATEDARNGPGATARPSSWSSTAASSRPRPAPPWVSGTRMPSQPASAKLRQSPASWPAGSAAILRTRSIGHSRSRISRAASRSCSCSSEREKSTASPQPARGSPRPRCAMMFFWICEVPPPMIMPRLNMNWYGQSPSSSRCREPR